MKRCIMLGGLSLINAIEALRSMPTVSFDYLCSSESCGVPAVCVLEPIHDILAP